MCARDIGSWPSDTPAPVFKGHPEDVPYPLSRAGLAKVALLTLTVPSRSNRALPPPPARDALCGTRRSSSAHRGSSRSCGLSPSVISSSLLSPLWIKQHGVGMSTRAGPPAGTPEALLKWGGTASQRRGGGRQGPCLYVPGALCAQPYVQLSGTGGGKCVGGSLWKASEAEC